MYWLKHCTFHLEWVFRFVFWYYISYTLVIFVFCYKQSCLWSLMVCFWVLFLANYHSVCLLFLAYHSVISFWCGMIYRALFVEICRHIAMKLRLWFFIKIDQWWHINLILVLDHGLLHLDSLLFLDWLHYQHFVNREYGLRFGFPCPCLLYFRVPRPHFYLW